MNEPNPATISSVIYYLKKADKNYQELNIVTGEMRLLRAIFNQKGGLHSLIKKAIDFALNDREKEVITLRFGLKAAPLTLAETGERMGGLSRERVRQIECKALRKLMHPTSKALLGYKKKEGSKNH